MDIIRMLGTLTIGLVIILGVIFISDGIYEEEAYDKACVGLGMEKANYGLTIFEQSYCIDYEGIAHEAIFRCEGFASKKKCKVNKGRRIRK